MRSRIALLSTAAALAVLSLTIAQDAPPPVAADEDLTAILDPNVVSRSLCGSRGMNRNTFFRPEFRLGLAKAQAAEAPTPAPARLQTFDDPAPLWDGVGNAEFAISSKNEDAQRYFNQGLRLAYAFNHWEAARAFRAAQKADPLCAICYWGEGLVLGHNINAPMDERSVEPAFAATAKAQALSHTASDLEKALIGALAVRYSPDPKADGAKLNQAYADAMAKVYKRYPKNDDVAALYAEAVMDTSPWNYYERDFVTPLPNITPAFKTVETVLKRNPDHAGAIHLYIHLTEASTTPERAEPFADKLAGLAPKAGHLVHMPGHTYFRTGRYMDSLKLNLQAVAVDEAYLGAVQGADIYRYGYYPHNVHFVLTSAQMAGETETVLEYAHKLDELVPFAAAEGVPLAHPVKASVYYALAQFGEPQEILDMEQPPASLPYVMMAWRYARALAFLELNQTAAVDAELAALKALADDPAIEELKAHNIPGRQVIELAAQVVEGKRQAKEGQLNAAIATFQAAAEAQSAIAYTEPPFWYYPVEQTLGALLLQAGQYKEAADAFAKALIRHPNNAWSLYGLMKAQEAASDPAAKVTAELYAKATSAKAAPPIARF